MKKIIIFKWTINGQIYEVTNPRVIMIMAYTERLTIVPVVQYA